MFSQTTSQSVSLLQARCQSGRPSHAESPARKVPCGNTREAGPVIKNWHNNTGYLRTRPQPQCFGHGLIVMYGGCAGTKPSGKGLHFRVRPKPHVGARAHGASATKKKTHHYCRTSGDAQPTGSERRSRREEKHTTESLHRARVRKTCPLVHQEPRARTLSASELSN